MPVRRRWATFYREFLGDLRENLAIALPMLALFALVLVPGSTTLLCAFECGASLRDWWESLYVTWQAMSTTGAFDEMSPRTLGGRLVVSLDALLGYSLLGVVVFMIARAAEKEGSIADR